MATAAPPTGMAFTLEEVTAGVVTRVRDDAARECYIGSKTSRRLARFDDTANPCLFSIGETLATFTQFLDGTLRVAIVDKTLTCGAAVELSEAKRPVTLPDLNRNGVMLAIIHEDRGRSVAIGRAGTDGQLAEVSAEILLVRSPPEEILETFIWYRHNSELRKQRRRRNPSITMAALRARLAAVTA